MHLNEAPRWGKRSPCSWCVLAQSCTRCCNLARHLAEGEKAAGRMTTMCRWLLLPLSLQLTGKCVAVKGIFLLSDGPEGCTGLGAALAGIPGGRKLTVWGGGGLHNKPCCCPGKMKEVTLECWGGWRRPDCCRGRWALSGEEVCTRGAGEGLKCSEGGWKRSVSWWQSFWLSTSRLCSFFLMALPFRGAPTSSPSVSSS